MSDTPGFSNIPGEMKTAIFGLLTGIFFCGCSEPYFQSDTEVDKNLSTILRSNHDVWMFPINQESPFMLLEDTERTHREYLTRLHAFINTERNVTNALTDRQNEDLMKLLLNPKNYYNGPFSICSSPRVGCLIKTKTDSLILLFGSGGIVEAYKKDLVWTAVLGDTGERELRHLLRECKIKSDH